MKKVVGTIGPVATAIYVSPLLMQYKRGVYNEANCSTEVNHAVIKLRCVISFKIFTLIFFLNSRFSLLAMELEKISIFGL
jgi:hypothetical protein